MDPTRVAEVRYLSYETTLHARGSLWAPGPDQVDLLDALEERGIQTLGHGIRLPHPLPDGPRRVVFGLLPLGSFAFLYLGCAMEAKFSNDG